MPNTPIPAAGEAMPEASIYSMLATYWQRVDEVTEAMRRTDDCESDTAEYHAAFAAQMEAGDRLSETENAIAAFVPAQRYEARVKAEFLIHLADGNHGRLEEDVTASLLSSLPDLVKWSSENRRASV